MTLSQESLEFSLCPEVLEGCLKIPGFSAETGLLKHPLRIQHSEIRGRAFFVSATFRGDADFRSVTFHGGAYFGMAKFMREAYFNGATFEGHLWFPGARFMADAAFSGAICKQIVGFPGAIFEREVHLNVTTMEHPADLLGIHFRENTVSVGLWNDILRPIVGILSIRKIDLPEKPVTRFPGFNTARHMESSSNPYLKRYIDDEQWIASWRKRGRWYKVPFFFWELTSHCGRSFGLWLFWSLVLAIAFGAVYADYTVPLWLPPSLRHLLISVDPQVDISPGNRIPTPFTPYYFSIVTFTTLGFGDVKPLNLAGEIWLVLEVLLGYTMLGGLISIFANKLARRA